MADCTCKTKHSFIHMATCAFILDKLSKEDIEANKDNHSALYALKKLVNTTPDGIFFYVGNDENGTVAQYKTFKEGFSKDEWEWQVGVGGVHTIMFSNNAEVTFLPESESINLIHQPTSTRILIEKSDASQDLAEILMPNTGGILFVDPKTKDLIS